MTNLAAGDIGASSDVHENLEFPLAPFMYAISCMHCLTLSLALDGAGLGARWSEAGPRRVDVKWIADDLLNAYYIATKA